MALSAPARWILIGLISIGLQVCCCNVGSILSDCCSDAADNARHSAPVAKCHGHHDQNANDEVSGDGHPVHSKPHDSQPCTPDQGGNCACGTHDKAPNLGGKILLDFAPALIAVLPVEIQLAPMDRLSTDENQDDRAVFSRRTSLLRQHCALVV